MKNGNALFDFHCIFVYLLEANGNRNYLVTNYRFGWTIPLNIHICPKFAENWYGNNVLCIPIVLLIILMNMNNIHL